MVHALVSIAHSHFFDCIPNIKQVFMDIFVKVKKKNIHSIILTLNAVCLQKECINVKSHLYRYFRDAKVIISI